MTTAADEPVARGDVIGLHHAGVAVEDMERSLAFYVTTLGLEVVSDVTVSESFVFEIAGLTADAIRIVCLRAPGTATYGVELLEYIGVERRHLDGRPCDVAAGHLCVEVRGIDELCQRLVDAGYRTQSPLAVSVPPNDGGVTRVLYVQDADGYCVELLERAVGSSEGGRVSD